MSKSKKKISAEVIGLRRWAIQYNIKIKPKKCIIQNRAQITYPEILEGIGAVISLMSVTALASLLGGHVVTLSKVTKL